jgi:hypothetical protein
VARADIAATVAALGASGPNASAPTWIVSLANLGKLTLDQGRLTNYPIVTLPSAGPNLILLDAAALAVADDGVALDTSNEAMVEMSDAPTPATAATIYLNLWQANMVGVRTERYINWKLASGALAFTTTLT